ncbi:MAG: PhzF family phenazine biosynthesis protein [Planctomycetes bacterium]|nr:PhzF family phenazine biosynthesis protein [Planctomycetota bacterium]MCP4838929.1 PhzF family phenazine biosynthesis protein [Planctomycetota bacterium]
MITVEEVKQLGNAFWTVVGRGGDASAAEDLFLQRGLLLPNGAWVDLEAHQALHRPLRDESHDWIDLTVKELCRNPERVLATGTVHWEATVVATGGRIVSDVGEQWVIERGVDGRIRFVHYWSDSITFAEESAWLDDVR